MRACGGWTRRAPEQALTLERVTRIVQNELRRRLGGSFTLDELADLYDEGTGWCTDLAVEVAPDEAFAWDARIVADAAFGRYQRAATDYAGGRRRRGNRETHSVANPFRFGGLALDDSFADREAEVRSSSSTFSTARMS